MPNYYNQDVNEIFKQFSVSQNGLSTEEAKRRLEEHGHNELTEKKKRSFLQMFFYQFKSFMILILIVAAVISGVIGVMEGEGLIDTYVIMGILLINAFIGASQEKKAESSLEALKNMSAPEAKVVRNGKVSKIPSQDIVPGDIVVLETGDIVPADLRLSEAFNMKVQESAMTGESVPVEKQTEIIQGNDIALGDRKNMAFASGTVTYGRGRGIVVETGMNTEVGKIAGMLDKTIDTETPMKTRLEKLGKILGITALVICGVIFIIGILYGNSFISMFMTAVSLAVAAIPEGLPAISTVVLAIGVQRLVKKNAIIRTLPSVETLGSATVICSDKTGTLTQNKMTVVQTFSNNQILVIDRNNPGNLENDEEKILVTVAVLCCDARINILEDGNKEFSGDPTETALLDIGSYYGLDKNELEKSNPRVKELPFDSERKRMTTVNKLDNKKSRVNVKGGLDEILSVCKNIRINNQIKPLTDIEKKKIEEANEGMANSALRVLAMAYKDIDGEVSAIDPSSLEKELIFIGMLGMIDPPRPEVIEAVAKCVDAGIKPVMITGDHKNTAVAIAREIGILHEGDTAITGTELQTISDEDFKEKVKSISVYARVAPEHKVRIVDAWQKNDQIVAMTGDGINDAPALKKADIGAAMGVVGTDVAKGASDMVLTDDNFATIVSAVEEGRRIYDNILKVIQFLLSTNIGEIFLLLVTSIFNMGIPLLPIHILWVNLVTDSLPALALSIDPAENDIMKRKPRNPKTGFMTKGMIWRIMYQGVMIGSLPLAAYIIGLHDGGQTLGQTMAFATLIFAQLVHVRNLHSIKKSSFLINPLKNKTLIGAIFVSAVIGLLVMFVPVLREIFRLTEMDSSHWTVVILLSLVPIAIVDFFKLLKINSSKDEN